MIMINKDENNETSNSKWNEEVILWINNNDNNKRQGHELFIDNLMSFM